MGNGRSMATWRNRSKILSIRLIQINQPSRWKATRLAEVGKFEVPKVQGKYDAGQLFLHKVFGYRGVILFPWVARLYDRNLSSKPPKDPLFIDHDETSVPSSDGEEKTNGDNEVPFEVVTYYQALIDQRDCPHIRAHPESVTFLGKDKETALYAVPGLDYVNHEDVLPYISTEGQPIHHELFEKFLANDLTKCPPLSASHSLRVWHEKNHKWLELSDVHRETTESIRVTVIPFFMGSRVNKQDQSYWWRYCIRLENLGTEPVQLRERHWRIFSLSGTLETVRGRGVVGQQPVLSSAEPAFQYSSHVSLQSTSGHMWGTYRMERPNGSMFDIRIPPFTLESREVEPFVD